jgi:glycosyl hydrolase family 32
VTSPPAERQPSYLVRTSLRHPCILALAVVTALLWFAPAARAAAMLAPPDERPKDFAFIKKDGVYHLFYIRHNDFLPPFATEVDFGHAISTDLYHWTQLPPVMGVNPTGWDNLHVWAPNIIESAGLYWMFYTGVTETPGQFSDTQRIGVAVSTDLMTWNRVLDRPVWDTSAAPWAWWAPQNASVACRDPFVMPDPAAPGEYLLYYTASPASDTVATLVGVARSPIGDLTQWVNEKPLWVTHRSISFNALTESPHLFQHNGRWFLFITANAGQPLSFYVGSDPIGEPAQWIYRGRLRNMLGVDTGLWFASEYLRDGNYDLFAYCAASLIEIRRIVWGTGDNFSLTEPAFFHVVGIDWTRTAVREFEPVGLRISTANYYASDRHLVAFVQDWTGAEQPVPLDSLGLSATPSLTSDSTVVPWIARRWPATLDPREPMRLRVAMDDGSATTPWLAVASNTLEQGTRPRPGSLPAEVPDAFPLPGEPVGDTLITSARPVHGAAPALASGLALRALGRTPLGGGPAVTFQLARPGPVRADVFDLQGRRVVTLADHGFAAGAQVLMWDGRDAGGVRVRRGLYFVRVSTPGFTAGTRFLLER